MSTDALSRRLRFAPPKPKQARIVLTEADLLMFEAIDRHGPLPTHYLYEVQRHVRRNYRNVQNRFTEFYNGTVAEGPYLVRPPRQFEAWEARHQHVVYDLAPRARIVLGARRCAYPPSHSAWFLHQLMQACVAMSFELLAPEGLRYVTRSEVLTHKGIGEARAATNPLALPVSETKTLIPDDLFAIQNPAGDKRYFMLEVDRATESMSPAGIDRNDKGEKTTYFGKKLEHYREVYASGKIWHWWGFAKPKLLIVTTNERRVRQILEHVASLNDPAFAELVHVTFVPEFDLPWSIPKQPLSQLYKEWATVKGMRKITEA